MRLKTFGGLWIEGGPASPSPGPRQLGLLALVASAGRKGITRERVIGLLWSESPEEQARHTLSQTVYSLKREAGKDLIAGSTHLRLDPSVSSDIGDLLAAAAAGELETVAGLYTGTFLDGFYLPGAPEFEHWVEEERTTLAKEVQRALERLAKRADDEGKPAEAVRWWQRLADQDPLSGRYAAGHMRALAAVGDRTGALNRARTYETKVHRELGAEPDAVVRDLERSLRLAPPAPAVSAALPPLPNPEPPEVTREPSRADTIRTKPTHWSWLAPLTLFLLVAAALTAWAVGRASATRLPFLAVGMIGAEVPSDSSRLGPILRDMLSTSLGGVAGLQVVANSRLVELMPRGTDGLAATNDAARRAGANEVIEGEVTSASGELVLSLRRVDLASGVVRKGYIVRARDRYAMVDSATAAIARDLELLPPSVMVAQIRTSSPAAYALYEEGLRAHYGYDGPAAYRLMEAALARDSNFAMAAYYAWQLSRNFASESTSALARARAKRLATRTIERERLLILGAIAEVEAPLRQALAIAETLTVKYPSDPEGQILLGDVRGRAGDWAGAVDAYDQAVIIDSVAGTLAGPYCRVCYALAGMSQQYLWWDSAGAAERASRRLLARRPAENFAWNNPVEPLLRQRRRAEAEAAYARANPRAVKGKGPLFRRDRIRWGEYEEGDRELIEDAQSEDDDTRSEAWWLLAISLRDQGRLREADTLIHGGRIPNSARVIWESTPHDLLMLSLEIGRPRETIRSYRLQAEGTLKSAQPDGVRNRYLIWYLTLAGTAYAAAGDTAVVRRLADSLEVLGQTSMFGRDIKLHYFLRGLLLRREGRHADAVDAFRRSLFSLTDGYTRTSLEMARSLVALGRFSEAIAVLQPAIRGGVDGSNTYVSRTELHETLARAFEGAGLRDSAVAHWRAVESAWRHADPQFRDRYLEARRKGGL